jgi:hypothetical protein
MKTSLALLVAATSVFVFTQAADAQCGCQPTVSYYAPVPTTVYYAAPVIANQVPIPIRTLDMMIRNLI